MRREGSARRGARQVHGDAGGLVDGKAQRLGRGPGQVQGKLNLLASQGLHVDRLQGIAWGVSRLGTLREERCSQAGPRQPQGTTQVMDGWSLHSLTLHSGHSFKPKAAGRSM